MGYTTTVIEGFVTERVACKIQQFDYEAYNARQNFLLDQQERSREIMHEKADVKRNAIGKLRKQWQSLCDLWEGTDKRKKTTLRSIMEQIMDVEEKIEELL